MEQTYFEELMESLEDAAAFAAGDRSRAREVKTASYECTAEDVVRTRKALNLTQSSLAFAVGVSTRTVEAWEAGRNRPSGAAKRLLYLLKEDPSLLDRLRVQP